MNNYLNNYNYFQNYSQNQSYKQNVNNDIYSNNSKSNQLYNPYQGYIRGNLFENLYNPYKIKEPYDIKPMNEQAELLTFINSLAFACIDLNLYLDVNPNDRNIIDLFNEYKKEKKNLMEEYQNKYGPLLLNSDSLNNYPWAWNNRPWPWEI